MSGFLSDVGGFAKGFGQGVWGGATGMVHGIGTLAEGAYDIATDPNARAQAWNNAVSAAQTAEWAVENPGDAASAIGQGATNVYNNFVTAEQQAEANGQGAQFWGNAAGQGAFAVGTVLVPGLAEAKLAGAAGEAGEIAEGANALEGAAALTDEGTGASFLLRGDARPPSDIFDNGFQPWGGDASLQDYVLNNSPSQYVGLTTDPNVAADFATDYGSRNGFVYATDPQPGGIVVNDAFPGNPFAAEQEVAVPGGVPGSQIRGGTPIGPDYQFGDFSVLNPNYAGAGDGAALTGSALTGDGGAVAPGLTAPDLLNASSLTGAGLLGAGALGNSFSPPADPSSLSQTPLYSVTYGVNPDGSLQTISPPALVSPGDPSIVPPAPLTPDPAAAAPDSVPAAPPASPDDPTGLDGSDGSDGIDDSFGGSFGGGGGGGDVDAMMMDD